MRLALLALVACGGAAPLPTGPSFAVIEVGAEPRSVLRYETAPDATERFAVTYKSRTTTTFENTVMEQGRIAVDMPSIRAVGVLTATAVSPTGDADIAVVIEAASVLNDVLDPQTRTMAAKSADAMRGKRGSFSRASSGELSDVLVAEGFDEAIRASAMMFPRVPIGIGARWSQTTSVDVAKTRWFQTATYTLRDRTEDTVTIDADVTYRAGEQALHAEPNATTRLKGGSGRGSAHFVISLRGLGLRGKWEDSRTLDALITRGRTRVEASITAEAYFSYDGP